MCVRTNDNRVLAIGDQLGDVVGCLIFDVPADAEEPIRDAIARVGIDYQGFTISSKWIPTMIPTDTPPANPIRNTVLTTAQSAVGVQLLNLSISQQRALLACLLFKVGALDSSLSVLPLTQWL